MPFGQSLCTILLGKTCEDSLDAMKVSSEDVDVILVGGGAIVLPEKLAGAKTVTKHAFGGVANAIGSHAG